MIRQTKDCGHYTHCACARIARALADRAYDTANAVGARHILVTAHGGSVRIGCERPRDVEPLRAALADEPLISVYGY